VDLPPSLSQRISGDELINTSQDIKDTVDEVWEAMKAGRPHAAREVCTETMFLIHHPMESQLADNPKIKAFRNTGIEFRVYGYPNFDADKYCRCPQHVVNGSELQHEGTAIFTQVYRHKNSRCSSYFYRSAPDNLNYARMPSASPIPSGLSDLAIRLKQYKETLNHEIQKIVTEHAQNDQMSKLRRAEACSRDVKAMMSRDSIYNDLEHEILWPNTDKEYLKPDTRPIRRDRKEYFPINSRQHQ